MTFYINQSTQKNRSSEQGDKLPDDKRIEDEETFVEAAAIHRFQK